MFFFGGRGVLGEGRVRWKGFSFLPGPSFFFFFFLSANILWLSVINVIIFLKAFLKKSLLKYTKAYWLTDLCFITIFNREFRMLYWSNPRRSVAVDMLLSKREGFVQIGADLFTTQHFKPGWMLMVCSENIMAPITSKLIFLSRVQPPLVLIISFQDTLSYLSVLTLSPYSKFTIS